MYNSESIHILHPVISMATKESMVIYIYILIILFIILEVSWDNESPFTDTICLFCLGSIICWRKFNAIYSLLPCIYIYLIIRYLYSLIFFHDRRYSRYSWRKFFRSLDTGFQFFIIHRQVYWISVRGFTGYLTYDHINKFFFCHHT